MNKKRKKLKCLESINIQPLCYYGINTFRSQDVLNMLHGLGLCEIIVFNIIFEWLPHLCTPLIKLFIKVPKSSSEFQTQIHPQSPGRLSNASQIWAPIGRWVKKKKKLTLNIPLSMVKLLHFGWCIDIQSHHKDTGVLPNSVAGEEGNTSGISPWGLWWL